MSGNLILLIEDNKNVQDFNNRLLRGEGFAIETAMTLAEAQTLIKRQMPDAVVLDIGMPDGSGLDFLREFRQTTNVPVLMLTGYGKDKDIVAGFESGCDDYLSKPYTFEVLLARLKRLLQSAEKVPDTVIRGPLTLRLIPMEAYVGGEDLRLTKKDFALLWFFIRHEEQLIDNDTIYEKVWGQPMAGDSQALGGAVSRLRKKLRGCSYSISTEYGHGYRFERGES